MPRVPITTHRIKRYYHPLTIHARFSPERLLSPEPMTKDRVFQPEPNGYQVGCDLIDDLEPALVSKPSGEVTRLRRNGYSLSDVLKWSDEQYDTIQASLSDAQTRTVYLLFLLEFTLLEVHPIVGNEAFGSFENFCETKPKPATVGVWRGPSYNKIFWIYVTDFRRQDSVSLCLDITKMTGLWPIFFECTSKTL